MAKHHCLSHQRLMKMDTVKIVTSCLLLIGLFVSGVSSQYCVTEGDGCFPPIPCTPGQRMAYPPDCTTYQKCVAPYEWAVDGSGLCSSKGDFNNETCRCDENFNCTNRACPVTGPTQALPQPVPCAPNITHCYEFYVGYTTFDRTYCSSYFRCNNTWEWVKEDCPDDDNFYNHDNAGNSEPCGNNPDACPNPDDCPYALPFTTTPLTTTVTEQTTTDSFTTAQDTTEMSSTESFTTEASTTETYSTETPTTEISTTEIPTTEISTTEISTEIPTTEISTTEISTTETYSTETYATETDATETDATETTATYATESDATETDSTETTATYATESDATETFTPGTDATETTETYATDTYATETYATETYATELGRETISAEIISTNTMDTNTESSTVELYTMNDNTTESTMTEQTTIKPITLVEVSTTEYMELNTTENMELTSTDIMELNITENMEITTKENMELNSTENMEQTTTEGTTSTDGVESTSTTAPNDTNSTTSSGSNSTSTATPPLTTPVSTEAPGTPINTTLSTESTPASTTRHSSGSPCINISSSCTEGDKMADKEDCSLFYECDPDGVWIQYNCMDVNDNKPFYSAWKQKCQQSHLVDCRDHVRCDPDKMDIEKQTIIIAVVCGGVGFIVIISAVISLCRNKSRGKSTKDRHEEVSSSINGERPLYDINEDREYDGGPIPSAPDVSSRYNQSWKTQPGVDNPTFKLSTLMDDKPFKASGRTYRPSGEFDLVENPMYEKSLASGPRISDFGTMDV